MSCILGLVCALPVHPEVCDRGCHPTTTQQRHLQFSHVLELQNKSIAPWTLKPSHFDKHIPEAYCHECLDPCLKSEAIQVQVYFTQPKRNLTTGSVTYCLCTYKLAVGCTCVRRSAAEMSSRSCTFRSQESS
uniref:Secreted protein n=1 Tax=Knipowitschia caucasica TaxID=637954 RepID=A0AAV2LXK0_KNICA